MKSLAVKLTVYNIQKGIKAYLDFISDYTTRMIEIENPDYKYRYELVYETTDVRIEDGGQTNVLCNADTLDELRKKVMSNMMVQEALLEIGLDHIFMQVNKQNTGHNSNHVIMLSSYEVFEVIEKAIDKKAYINCGSVTQESYRFRFTKDYNGEGIIYKNELALVFFKDFPCYVAELYNEDDETSYSDEYDTRSDFINYCADYDFGDYFEMSPKVDNIVSLLFQQIQWETPSTLVDQWAIEGV
jgi:hypothetical protein